MLSDCTGYVLNVRTCTVTCCTDTMTAVPRTHEGGGLLTSYVKLSKLHFYGTHSTTTTKDAVSNDPHVSHDPLLLSQEAQREHAAEMAEEDAREAAALALLAASKDSDADGAAADSSSTALAQEGQ